MINFRKLETELWEAADLLRADSKVTSQEYCMPVLGLIFLRYAYSRFKFVEADILKDRPVCNGGVLPVEAADFKTKSAIFLPKKHAMIICGICPIIPIWDRLSITQWN